MSRHNDYDFDGDPYVIIERRDSGIGPLLLGIALGAGAALLFAPRSGADTRQLIKTRTREATDTARERMDDLAATVSESVGEARDAVTERVDHMRSAMLRRRDELRDAFDAGKSAAHHARVELQEKLAERKANDRASNGRTSAEYTPPLSDDIA